MTRKTVNPVLFCLFVVLPVTTLASTLSSDGKLHYEIRGKGEPVIFIHGGLVDSRMWDAQVEEFEKHFQVIRYDLRGFGKSDVSTRPYSHIDDLQTLLKSLKIEKASIIGLSLGGMIAIDFTLEHPEMVDKLILAGAALRGYAYKSVGNRDAIYEAAKKGDVDKAVELSINDTVFVTARKYPDVEKKMREMLRDNFKAWGSVQQSKVFWPKTSSIDRISQIRNPTLIIVGDKDNENILGVADVLKQKIIHSHKRIIPDAGHHLNMEKPQEFNTMVLRFLTGK